MSRKTQWIVLSAIMLALPAIMHAQFDFKVQSLPVQIHSFASEGFAYSGGNNYLTMNTNSGSFAFTDGGANVSVQLTDNFRIGAQVYVRNVGQLGAWSPKLDWAFADYKFNRWIGIRAGRVKTVLGLYNDTQDVDAAHTFALLPQSIYPTDLRSAYIAHDGVDIYGTIPLFGKNEIKYTAYAGVRVDDQQGGSYYAARGAVSIQNFGGNVAGIDLRYDTPLPGLTIGVSHMAQSVYLDSIAFPKVSIINGMAIQVPALPDHAASTSPEEITQPYVEYTSGRWHLAGEFRRDKFTEVHNVGGGLIVLPFDFSNLGWYASAAFRVSKNLELGTYHSRFYLYNSNTPNNPASTHMFDQAVTARVDFRRHYFVKIEGHFMSGYSDPLSSTRGFYLTNNPAGLKPKTNLAIVRTGISF